MNRWSGTAMAVVLLAFTCRAGASDDTHRSLAPPAVPAKVGCAAPTTARPVPPPVPARLLAPGVRIGLALGGGSTHGHAHIGVIQELEARGLQVQVVAGTSVGALVGALWSSGLSGTEIEQLSRGSRWEDLGSLSGSGQGLLSNHGLRAQLTPLFKGRLIESWPRRFGAVATHLDSGERRVLKSGDGALAIQASSAVPILYTPVLVNGERLADGALVEPVPAETARSLGADYVIAVDVAYRPNEDKADGIAQLGFQTMHILINALGARQMAGADFPLKLDLHHTFMACGGAGLIAAGRAAMAERWPALEKSLAERVRKDSKDRSTGH